MLHVWKDIDKAQQPMLRSFAQKVGFRHRKAVAQKHDCERHVRHLHSDTRVRLTGIEGPARLRWQVSSKLHARRCRNVRAVTMERCFHA
mmetsp:Transcript_8602/g.30671  ORF Transcript_8602/g.30671 Transcript_8602/m.30671 type:complete len:89 (-) Transcript_8602:94-360(-)